MTACTGMNIINTICPIKTDVYHSWIIRYPAVVFAMDIHAPAPVIGFPIIGGVARAGG